MIMYFISISFSDRFPFLNGAQVGRSPLGRSDRPILDIPAGTFLDQETTQPANL